MRPTALLLADACSISVAPALRGGTNPSADDVSDTPSPIPAPPPDPLAPGPYEPNPPFLGQHSISDESRGSSNSSGATSSILSASTAPSSVYSHSFDYGVNYPKVPPSLRGSEHDPARTLMPSLRPVPPPPSLQQQDSLLPPVSPGDFPGGLNLSPAPYAHSAADAYFYGH